MVQHLLDPPEQSESALQNWRPPEAAPHTFGAPGASDLVRQASPLDVSHVASVAQKRGQLVAALQIFPLGP